MKKFFLALPLLFWGCADHFAAFQKSDPSQDVVFEELRTDIADVKHSLHTQEIELRLLEEKIESEGVGKNDILKQQIAALQRKVEALEQNLEKASADLRTLASHATQTTASLSQYRDRIQEIESSSQRITPLSATVIHVVKSGETLQKIANRYKTSTEVLKKNNNLSSDRIVAGQKLKISSTNG